jgi:hypothetical protein
MRSRTNALLVAAAVAIASAALAPATIARADHDIDTPFTGSRPFQLDVHGGLAWYGFGFAGGARFGIPIVHNGFIPSLDNAVYLNFGIDTYFVDDRYCYDWDNDFCQRNRGYRFAMGFPVTLHWEFYFNDTWSVFGEIGVQIYLPPSLFYRGYVEYYDHAGMWFVAAAGGTLHLGEVFALTLRVGNPYVAFGITLNLG